MTHFFNSLKARRRNRRARFAHHGRRPYGFEQLERRHLLAAVNWTGMGDGTHWADPNNWSGNAVPGQFDDVTINAAAGTTVFIQHGDIEFINSLTSSSPIFDGGALHVTTTAQMSANLTVGNELDGGTWNFSNGAVMNVVNEFTATLGGITLNGNLDAASIDSLFLVTGGLTLNGTMLLGNSSGTTFGDVAFGTQEAPGGTIDGTGSIQFGASSQNLIENNALNQNASNTGTLTIGAGITIHGQTGTIFRSSDQVFHHGDIVNLGTINADGAGGTVTISAPGLSNQGTIEATQGGIINFNSNAINPAGGLILANGGTVSQTSGQFNNDGSVQATNGGTLTINNLVNAAGATVSVDSSTLTLQGAFIDNEGTITATNSTVNLIGEFSQAGLGTFNRTGGTVNVSGKVDGDLVLNSTTGSWNFIGNVILQDGQITENDGVVAGFAATGQILARETIHGDLNLTLASSGYLYVLDSLTVTGNLLLGNASGTNAATIFLGTGAQNFGSTSSYANTQAGLHISDNTKLIVGGQIIFGPSFGNAIVDNNLHIIPPPGPNDPPADDIYFDGTTATYFGGSAIEISGAITGSRGSIAVQFSRCTIQIDDSLTADGANSAFQVGGSGILGIALSSLINKGTLQATNGASLTLNDLSQTTGTVSVTNSALRLGGTLANASTITATNSSVDLNGTFTQAGLGTFNRPGSTVSLSGTLSGGLTLDANTGSWFLHGGTIDGGTVTENGGAELAFTQFGGFLGKVTSGVTSHVTFNGDMDFDGGLNPTIQGVSQYLFVYGGLTLNGTMFLGNAADSAFGSVYFGDNVNAPGSLLGNGTVVFSGPRTGANFLANGWQGPGAQTLTIGPNITIRGRSGSLTQINGTTGNTIVLEGTISADVAGGTIQLGASGPVINQGTIQAINGGGISGISLVNSPGKTITVNGSTLSLSGNWNNAGTIISTDSTLNLGGSFTRATLGNFVRTGGTVNITGALSGGLNLDAANGSWTLLRGTINGGSINISGGSQLILSNVGGTIAGVTINGNVDATQQSAQATFTGGLVLNGTITVGAGNNAGTLTFGAFNVAAGSLTGSGAIVFGSNVGNGNSIHNGSNLAGASGTLTIGPNITIHGKTGGLFNDFGGGTIINHGKIIAEDAAGTILIGNGIGTFVNQGSMQANNGSFRVADAFNIDGRGTLSTNWAGSVSIVGNGVSGASTAFANSNPQGVMTFSGGNSSANPQLLEAMSQDLGATAAGFKQNFVYGTINDDTANMKLVDQSDNAPGGPDALYVNSIFVNSFKQLDLNGVHVYARAVQINGGASVINGTITQIPDGGAIDINSPLPGAISPAGNQDTWTFFGRAGEAVTAYVNPGIGTAPTPIVPNLNFANIQLVAPNNAVLASGNSASLGAAVSLPNITLPTDGVYTIKVGDAAGRTTDTGNYVVAVWDVTPQVQPLLLGQTTNGSIRTPFDLQQWTFTALANEQVKFHLASETSTGLVYSLIGPNGFTGFSNILGDSPLVTLPSNGTYTLSVQGTNGATGNYAFAVNPTAQNTLPLNGAVNGTLAGSGQAELYSIAVPAVQTLAITLDDSSNSDSNELYLKFGSPPTRETHDYRYSNASAADQSILVPSAAIGTWYVLVYGTNVAAPSAFSLAASGYTLHLTGSTPGALGNSAPENLMISGAGFQPGAQVTLVGPGNAQFAPNSTSVISYTQMSAKFAAGLPPGNYSVKVTQGTNSDTLSNAFTVTAGGSAHLETALQLPDQLGRHVAATFYVTFANTGTVAMPAPLLELSDPNPLQRPLLTLDPTKITQGLYTSVLPAGYSNTITILASGEIPGVLLPGETITVPVYYAGMQQPFDFVDNTVTMNLGVLQTTDTDPIDWSSFKSQLQPPDVTAAAWDRIYANLTSQLGTTDGQFVAALDANAAYLGGHGENLTDINRLFNFMYLQANDALGPVGALSSALDAALPLPGGNALSFSRDYALSLAGRDTLGILGYGWSANYQSKLTINSDGTVDLTFGVGGATATFDPDTRSGGFFSPIQTLTLATNLDGSYTLKNKDGSFENFTASGTLANEQDTNGNRITINRNAGGQIIGLVASSGQSLILAYNGAGRLVSITDSDGRLTTYAYDPTNQYLQSVTDPAGTISYTYDPASNALSSIAYPDGTHQFFTYDSLARLATTSLDGGVGAITFSYTAPGEITATNAVGDVTRRDYNFFGQLVRFVDGLGNPSYATFDDQFNLLSLTDAVGDAVSYAYDASGNLTSMTDPLHGMTHFAYGPNSRLTSFTDPNGNSTGYTYDAGGNLLTTTFPNATQESSTYDPLGDPISFVNRNGQTTSLIYNNAGQVTKETFADGSHYDYVYDTHDNLLTATDATGTTTFTYDAADRMTSVAYPNGTSLTFTYDAGGRRTSIVDQSGYTITYMYTPAGDLSQLTDGGNQPIVTYRYDAARRLQEQENANGTFTTIAYDAAGHLLHLVNHAPGGAVNSRFDYSFDVLGQTIAVATLDGTWSYSYDADRQLVRGIFTSTNPSLPNQDLAYNYDAAGNRTSTIINGVTTTYATNALNEYTNIGGAERQFDADGNLLFDGTNTYSYDQLDELIGVSNAQGGTQYAYNALGQRVSTTAGAQTAQFLNDPIGLGDVTGTYNGAGSLVAHFNYGLSLVNQVAASGSTYFYDFDATGSTAGLTDTTGGYANRYRYLPFGESQSGGGAIANSFQFVGALGVQSDSTNTAFMRARYYNVSTGSFITADPLRLGSGETNFYRYAFNRPIDRSDPSGLGLFDYEYEAGPRKGYHYDIRTGMHGGYAVCIDCPVVWALRDSIAQQRYEEEQRRRYEASLDLPYDDSEFGDYNPEVRRMRLRGYSEESIRKSVERSQLIRAYNKFENEVEQFIKEFAARQLFETFFATAVDPNDKVGPGFGAQGYMAAGSTLPYRIDFENDPTATAPAQQVVITDKLSANVDWSSFRITEVGWGDVNITVPANSQHYQTTVPMAFNAEIFNVEVQVGINLATGIITAQFFSIDPTTQLPPDVLTGFLPPEDGTGRGQGHISYTISAKAGLSTGTQIRNVADVSFDAAPIIATDQVSETDPTQGTDPAKEALVTIDAGPPTSTVAPLPPQETTPSFTVSWSGSDDAGGSGIASFDVFVSTDGGPFVPFETGTTAASATFDGAAGHTYGFYSVATDNVGHRQPTPTAAQASTTIVALIVSTNADSGAGTLRQAILDANNAPGSPHTIQFQLPTGAQSITLLSPLPTAADSLVISLDATQNVTVVGSPATAWNNDHSLTLSGAGSLAFGGGINGTGDLAVSAGGNLTANHIIQGSLVIGGTPGSPAIVTIAASDASGNPLVAELPNAASSSIAGSASSASHNEAINDEPPAALRARRPAHVAVKPSPEGGISATREPQLAAVVAEIPGLAQSASSPGVPDLTGALFGENAGVTAPRALNSVMNWEEPGNLSLNRDSFVIVAKIEFMPIRRNTVVQPLAAGSNVDAALAESDFVASLDDSLLELLVVATHRDRPPLIKM